MTGIADTIVPAAVRRRASQAGIPVQFATSAAAGWAQRGLFAGIERYCMFIGYPRSGHSLVGSLIDAHPDAVVAHELDVLRFVQARFRRSQIFALILRNDREFTEGGRVARTGDYQYEVPNQWQGRFRQLRVIGDKRGGRSSYRLARRPELLDQLRRTVRVPLRIVHVVRNPFDNITTMSRRKEGDGSIDRAMTAYFERCDTVTALRARLADDELIDIRHEDVIADPRAELTRLCRFLDLDPIAGYLDDCASIVYTSPHRSRDSVTWSPADVAEVERRMTAHPHLGSYSFRD